MSNYNKMMQKHFAAEKAASDKRIKRATRRLTRKDFEYVVEFVGVKAILRKENGKWVEHAYHATGTGSSEEVLRDYPLPNGFFQEDRDDGSRQQAENAKREGDLGRGRHL